MNYLFCFSYLKTIQEGDLSIGQAVTWLQENGGSFFEDCSETENTNETSVETKDVKFARLWIYSHHIYSKVTDSTFRHFHFKNCFEHQVLSLVLFCHGISRRWHSNGSNIMLRSPSPLQYTITIFSITISASYFSLPTDTFCQSFR